MTQSKVIRLHILALEALDKRIDNEYLLLRGINYNDIAYNYVKMLEAEHSELCASYYYQRKIANQ